MADIKSEGDLEINQDLRFQRKEWVFERWGWIAMVMLAIAALLGLFGDGLLSNATAKNEVLQVQYGRFEREFAPAHIEIQFDSQKANNEGVKLQVDRELLSFYNVEQITPEPDSTVLFPDHVTYIFKIAPGSGPFQVTFELQGNQIGIARGKIGVENGPVVDISQFMYP